MSRSGELLLGIHVVVLVGFVSLARGAERFVPAGYPNIQAAVDAAVDGDEVVLAPGTYTGPGNRDVSLSNRAVLIRGTNPAVAATVAATVIDCQGTAAAPHRAATLDCEKTGVVYGLAGLTIIGASADDGAVVCSQYSSPSIRHCVITGNTGSAIYCDFWSNPVIADCRIEGNTGGSHNGLAGRYGGGIQFVHDCNATVQACVIRGNIADFGGGVFCNSSWLDITDTEISGNQAVDQGGGVYWEDSAVTLVNCTLVANQAQAGGGLCGVSSIYNDSSGLRNSIIWGNTAPSDPQVMLTADNLWLDMDSLAVAYSLVQGGQEAVSVSAGWSLDWQADNLSGAADPLFVKASPAGTGNTMSTQQANDYRLLGTSPCVDAGDPALAYASRTDAAGQPRVLGAKADIGAYETTASQGGQTSHATLRADFNADGQVNMVDLQRMVAGWASQRGETTYDAAVDLDDSGWINVHDLLLFVQDFGKQA